VLVLLLLFCLLLTADAAGGVDFVFCERTSSADALQIHMKETCGKGK
jgi:hypothetical protein